MYVDKHGMIYDGLKKDGSRNYYSKKSYRDFKWSEIKNAAGY